MVNSAAHASAKQPDAAGENEPHEHPSISSEEPLSFVAYTYDGSIEGLLSAVFETYVNKEVPTDILVSTNLQLRLGQSERFIETNADHALRVRNGIIREAGESAFSAVLRVAASDDPDRGTIIYRFIAYIMDKHSGRNKRLNVLNDLANPIIGDMVKLMRSVANEEERMRQFIRFNQLENGVWFARCNPKASVIPFIMGHFVARFNIQPFIIYDENHHISGIYDGRGWRLVNDIAVGETTPTARNALMEEAWKLFYRSLSIDERYNPELRRHFMPMRLWKNLPEVQPSKPNGITPRYRPTQE